VAAQAEAAQQRPQVRRAEAVPDDDGVRSAWQLAGVTLPNPIRLPSYPIMQVRYGIVSRWQNRESDVSAQAGTSAHALLTDGTTIEIRARAA